MKTIMDVEYYDILELCKMFGLSQFSMRKYLRDEKIEGIKIGKYWLASKDSVNNFLQNTVKKKADAPNKKVGNTKIKKSKVENTPEASAELVKSE